MPPLRCRARPFTAPVSGVLAVLTLLAAVLPAVPLRAQVDRLPGFHEYTAQAAEDWGAVGLAVAVVQDDELVFSRGYGVRHLEEGGAVDGSTLFSIGSTTKAMTAAALGMLVEEGRLAWDDPVTDHLPDFRLSDPWLTREITVRDLLTHRAGIGNADFLWYEMETDREEVLERFRHAPVAYSPRSGFIYQNIMYAAAGAVIEEVSGLPWETFVERRIFEPLGMTRTVPLLADTEGVPNVAAPHHTVNGRRVPIANASVDPVRAAGSVWSSVDDMSLWVRTLLADGVAPNGTRILEAATVRELFRPQALVGDDFFYPTARITRPEWKTYGLGWFQHDYRGEKLDFHTGSIDGMVAIAGLIRERGIGVYVLGNLDHVEVRHALMYRALDHFLAPDEMRDWSAEFKELYDGIAEAGAASMARMESSRVEGTAPSHPLDVYTGTYGNDLFGTLQVSRDGEGLRVFRGPGLQGPLEHWHYDTFRSRWEAAWRGPWTLSFRTDARGRVSAVEAAGHLLERIEER